MASEGLAPTNANDKSKEHIIDSKSSCNEVSTGLTPKGDAGLAFAAVLGGTTSQLSYTAVRQSHAPYTCDFHQWPVLRDSYKSR